MSKITIMTITYPSNAVGVRKDSHVYARVNEVISFKHKRILNMFSRHGQA